MQLPECPDELSENEALRRRIELSEATVPDPSDEQLLPLSDRDRDLFLDLVDNPPEPNDAFRKAVEEYRQRHGDEGRMGAVEQQLGE